MQQRARRRLLLLSFLLVGSILAACSSRSPAPQVAEQASLSATVSVTAQEFSYTLDRTEATAGTITFVVQNSGTMAHDFAIEVNGVEQQTPLLEPGQSAMLAVSLTVGTYTYRCTVMGHELLGMKGTFMVK